MTRRRRDSRFTRGFPRGGREVRPRRRPAFVLLIVLVAVAILSLAAYAFSDLMLSHRGVAEAHGQRLQARMLVDSGVDYLTMYLMQDAATRDQMGGHFQNPAYFQGLIVQPEIDLQRRGCFTVIAPYLDDQGASGVRYGLEDESARLNLNLLLIADKVQEGAGRTLLLNLPNMTEDVADAILDWMDEDDEVREYGAESADYAGLMPQYGPRNGPLATVEELLLVRGVTPELLFGQDANRNGIIDPHEDATTLTGATTGTAPMTGMLPTTTSAATNATATSGSSLGGPFRGWAAYLTLYSSERNVASDGAPRIDLNQEDLQTLHDELSEVFAAEWVDFIVAYRLYDPPTPDQPGEPASRLELDLTQSPKNRVNQVLDLIGAKVDIPASGSSPRRIIQSPFEDGPVAMAVYLPALMDKCTAVEAESIPGRVNINAAPPEILLGIPGITEEIVDQIIAQRNEFTAEEDPNRNFETWLLSAAIVTLDKMRTLSPFICAGGDVFRAQIVGYYQGGGPSARAEVVFDTTGPAPRVLLWRDISHLGRGFALETLGVDLAGATF